MQTPVPTVRRRATPVFLNAKYIAVLWAALCTIVITGELLPAETKPIELLSETQINDKVFHFAAYAALAFLPVLAFRRRTAIVCVLAAEATSIALEFAQLLIPGRTCDFDDGVANTLGVLTGVAIAFAIERLLARRRL